MWAPARRISTPDMQGAEAKSRSAPENRPAVKRSPSAAVMPTAISVTASSMEKESTKPMPQQPLLDPEAEQQHSDRGGARNQPADQLEPDRLRIGRPAVGEAGLDLASMGTGMGVAAEIAMMAAPPREHEGVDCHDGRPGIADEIRLQPRANRLVALGQRQRRQHPDDDAVRDRGRDARQQRLKGRSADRDDEGSRHCLGLARLEAVKRSQDQADGGQVRERHRTVLNQRDETHGAGPCQRYLVVCLNLARTAAAADPSLTCPSMQWSM